MKNTYKNEAYIMGTVKTEPVFDHESYGEKFYCFTIAVKRYSETQDIITVMISERLIDITSIKVGEYMEVTGQYRSYNQWAGDKRKLLLYLFATAPPNFTENMGYDKDTITLEGYVCKPPVLRKTPAVWVITDVILAVNRAYGKTDYLPCICWGRLANYISSANVGQKISARGRIQSRTYFKEGQEHMVNEVSFNTACIIEDAQEESNEDGQ